MGMLASGAFAPKHRGPALVRLLVPGSRLLLIASETVQICQIHFTGERTVPCPGVPLCEHHEKFRTVNYGYVYCRVENTTWDVTVAEKDRVPVDPPWCIHELTEPAARELIAEGERRELDSFRGVRVHIHRGRGGRFGRMHGRHVRAWDTGPYATPVELDSRLTVPDVGRLLTFLYLAKTRSNRMQSRL